MERAVSNRNKIPWTGTTALMDLADRTDVERSLFQAAPHASTPHRTPTLGEPSPVLYLVPTRSTTGLRSFGEGRRPRRQHLAILFSDLVGSVALSNSMTPPRYFQLLHRLREVYRGAVLQSGGEIARMQGDGMLALFGLTGPPSDAGRQAICCALRLHAVVRSGVLELDDKPIGARLHSGVDAGPTFLEPGDLERGRYDLVGRVPNHAARLSALAVPDQILVTNQAINPHIDQFPFRARLMVTLKGVAHPVSVYALPSTCESGIEFVEPISSLDEILASQRGAIRKKRLPSATTQASC